MRELERAQAERATTTRTIAPAPQGRALDPRAAARIGNAYGHSFAHVRIHDDAYGAEVAARHRAIAVTAGSEIAFAPGYYRPGTATGDALLAHELAHVQQQRTGGDAPGTAHEADAHEATIGAVAHLAGVPGLPRRAPRRGAAIAPQRCGGLPSWAPPMPDGARAPRDAHKFASDRAIEEMLRTSAVVGPYIRPRMENGTQRCSGSTPPEHVVGHFHYHDESTWPDAVKSYYARSANPDRPGRCGGRGEFTEAEADARARSDLRGFEDHGEMHVREAKAVALTPIHEAIHRYQHPDFDKLPSKFVEGTTEYFAVAVGAEQKPKIERGQFDETYFYEWNVVNQMMQHLHIPDRVLAEAYFRGDVDGLRDAVDRAAPARPGRFAALMDRFAANDLGGALAVVS